MPLPKGFKHTEKTKRIISEKNKISMLGNKNCLRRKQSKETKKKISKTHQGMKYPKSFSKKISKSLMGQKREKCRAWRGGKSINKGYIYIYMPNHPYSSQRGYIGEHRLMAEKALGRYLKKNELVHHINCNRSDNCSSNLLICTQVYHMDLHRKMSNLYAKEHFNK